MKQQVKSKAEIKQQIIDRIEKINQGIVPEGYKETEIGIIPEDWEVNSFKDMFVVSQGLQIPISKRYTEYKESRYIYITNQYLNSLNLSGNNVEYIENPKESVICSKDDILMTRTGNTGLVITGVEGVFHNNFFKVKFNKENYSKDFLVYLLMSNYIQHEIQKLAGTSTIPDLSHTDFYSITSIVPEIRKQQKIADVLSTWDRAIELKESLIKEKEEQKKGFMQSLLLPEKNWINKEIGEISKVVTGTTPKTSVSEYYNGEYPWITPTDISKNKYIFTSERQLTEEGLKVGRFVPKDSLLITCIASIGKNAILKNDGSCNQQINAIYPSKEHSNEFLYYLISNNTNKLLRYAATTATAIINKATFESIILKLPPLPEQKRIAEILSTADREIELLKDLVEQLKEEKKGLMQLLLTGIVRVKGDGDE